jgi:glycosyltransferase involved in cell wall biosynthesis
VPKVSVLVPAYRPDYLDTCIASALAQTFGDFELLIGDDCPNDDVASVVAKWDDPRIRFGRNPTPRQPGANRDFLLAQATGKYIKFLFDDDFLLPRSIELLCTAADQLGAKLAFHERHIVDGVGRVQPTDSALAAGEVVQLTGDMFFEQVVGRALNWIGEPSNILIDAETLASMTNPFGIDDYRLRSLTDVALYSNFAHNGHKIVGLGYRSSAFRRHASQTSGQSSTVRSAGLFEFELIARWAADQGHLSTDSCSHAIAINHAEYRRCVAQLPELADFIDLGNAPDAAGQFYSAAFRKVLDHAYEIIGERVRSNAA